MELADEILCSISGILRYTPFVNGYVMQSIICQFLAWK